VRTRMAIVLAAYIALPQILWCRQQGVDTSGKGVVEQVWNTVDQKFIDPSFNHHDWRQIRHQFLSQPYASTPQAYAAVGSMLQLLGEPQTRFVNPAQLASTVQEFTGQIAGIGLSDPWVALDRNTGEFKILHLIADSPALKTGLQPLDVIQAVEGMPTKNLARDEILMRTRGKAGTGVQLTIRRGNKLFDVVVTRELLTVRTVRSRITGDPGKHFGYITLTQFAQDSAQEMRNAIVDLLDKGAQGFILDLRNDPGGFVPASRAVASLFIGNKELIYYSVDQTGVPKEVRTEAYPITDRPLVAIVNRATASAAEMLVGALKDNHRAALVGTKTFGQDLIHSLQPLTDGSGLVIAVARFKTPAGTDVGRGGISPDYAVESAETNLVSNTPATDPQYKEAARVLLQEVSRLQKARN
jgi:carboxyl-terminal processing protease